MAYYDGTKLLSLQDLNGNKPEIYMVTTNRTGGKTTYFGRLCVNKFLKYSSKFCLVYRYNYELDDIAEKFFKDLQQLFFQDYYMLAKRRANGIYYELFLCEIEKPDFSDYTEDINKQKPKEKKQPEELGVSCGYALALNNADAIKKMSHLFSDVDRMMMDEFQSETNHYCADEIKKLLSIHTSIARGQGKQVRYVPLYMCANPVSIINPYYVAMGISERLTSDTKFLRGDGFVLEQGYVDSASKAQSESGFNRAFASSSYVSYASQGVYLNDNLAFIEKPTGPSKYLATIRYNNSDYAIREYANEGIIYCDNKADSTFKYKLSVTTEDHQINYVMLRKHDMFLDNLRYFFEKGCFRFKDLRCKEAVLKALSY